MTQKMKHLWGLPTIEPDTTAVGACIAIGRKPTDRIGWPIEKDVLHIVETKTREREIRGGKIEYREHDPRFKAFNEAPKPTRQVFYAMLCYHNEEECWNPNYGMYRAPNDSGLVNPRSKRFSCTGNGREAERWTADGAIEIECPGEGCPFRQGKEPPCRPRARFWFLPVWKVSQGPKFARYAPVTDADGEKRYEVEQLLERPIMRLATQGREARDTFAGMLKTVRDQAEGAGFKIYSWWGLPFELRLSESRNPEKKTRWPDLTFTLAGDWMAWLRFQADQFRALKAAPQVALLGSASDAELDAEEVGAEHAAILPITTSKPAPVEPVDVEIVDELPEAAVSASPPAPPSSDTAVGSFSSSSEVEKEEPVTYYRTPEACDHPLHMREIIEDPESPGVACTACGEVFPVGDDSPPDFDAYKYLKDWLGKTGFSKRKMEVVIPLQEAGILKPHENWSDVPPGTTREELDAVLEKLEPKT